MPAPVEPQLDWIQLLSVGTNFSILIVGIKLIRHLSRMELKVDTMWDAFIKRFGITEKHESNDLGV